MAEKHLLFLILHQTISLWNLNCLQINQIKYKRDCLQTSTKYFSEVSFCTTAIMSLIKMTTALRLLEQRGYQGSLALEQKVVLSKTGPPGNGLQQQFQCCLMGSRGTKEYNNILCDNHVLEKCFPFLGCKCVLHSAR